MSSQHHTSSPTERHRLEGPRNHYLSYLISIILTMISFAVVLYGGLDRSFIIFFIVGIGVVQVIFQLAYWMHMKERGHMFPIAGLAFGAFVALSAVAAAVYWVWW
ncbi:MULTISPECIES: cytochrome C oxidase subunit IV family protein [Paenibacillus]|uniref:cytochrome C oxidase subunit IV family protein n=1 Tax=Paenibacillus TaxID=44249 RepID=UPI0022B8CCB4|nr:cytochrome C oxidase subunit IV family protein [Paenibacillus caseinilyticus]MCZ8523236.1 cytochrome C oxidase subunit IV family protein [Paenibacillus caseinilyticus]